MILQPSGVGQLSLLGSAKKVTGDQRPHQTFRAVHDCVLSAAGEEREESDPTGSDFGMSDDLVILAPCDLSKSA